MTVEALMQQMADWIAEITETEPPVITAETELVQDLGLDSLALAELAAKLRMRYRIKLRPGELQSDLRAGRLAQFVLDRQNA
jgi:acyl carrier protein